MKATVALFFCLAVNANAQQGAWWLNLFRTTTKSSAASSTSTTTMRPSMATGAAKTTPGLPRPPNDVINGISCGFSSYTEQEGVAAYSNQGIVGGTDARANEFPYQVRLNYKNSFICGGSVISNRHILTAAHCIIDQNAANFQVTLGDHNRNRAETGEKTYRISRVTVHPKYNQNNQNDLAILVTSENIAIDRKFIRHVCLPDSSMATDALAGQNAMVTGWGKLTENGASAVVLQKASIPILAQSDCSKSYGSSITSDMICAGYKNGGVDSCQGDSGGPMVVLASNGRFYLHGVTSWGSGCARKNAPGVYARVAYNLDWIKSTIAS